MGEQGRDGRARTITAEALRAWPLPRQDADGDKEDRGRALCVGGSTEVPGGLVLAGVAALRAGAGKLQLGACRGTAAGIGLAVPEARVFALPQTRGGDIAPAAATEIARRASRAQALLLGPGMLEAAALAHLLAALLPHLGGTPLILDAGAFRAAHGQPGALRRLACRPIMTPNQAEMAGALGRAPGEIAADPLGAARGAADAWRATVVLKGPDTYIAAPGGAAWCYRGGSVGLATSGSGDVLAGLLAGLLARGAAPAQAAAWAVFLHGEAGNRLAARIGRVGYLARELADEVPRLLTELEAVAESRGEAQPGR